MRKFLFFLMIPLLLTVCKSKPPVKLEVAKEPEIEFLEPEINVVSIVILQADLINTQFEAVVRIDNPNNFAVDLSSLSYELYGNGKFWANGKEQDILHIPALSSCETEFRFSMNFINMNRKLLDDVIALRQVRYRFSGDVEVDPDTSRLPSFHMNFERTGLSEVRPKVEKKQQSAKVVPTTHQPSPSPRFVDNW